MTDYVIGKVKFANNQTSGPNTLNGIRDWKVEHAICQKCGKRPATETWSEGTIAWAHGVFQRWCKVCVLTEQLAHARRLAASIPDLEAQLTNAQGGAE